ncbi:hypothetical protein JKA74_15490 [Marivirga sp. S37H4]|uniref:Lipoprotein n=1 Tax=Marivirga aurantiaca TaxID=2802615 RepID=A0A934X054_9BACT|nr:hypothetical protein [Marivirga aurantiaca]MBK6266448.1 hypothetical protein [Marivirga aurantiaca]
MLRKIFIFIFGSLVIVSCSKKQVSQSGYQNQQQHPSSLNPEETGRNYGRAPQKEQRVFFGLFKKKKKTAFGDQLIVEYEQRMKRNAKEAKKKEKEMQKPQYSDPSYFGHKRKPKKRSPDKMKFCKECGIRH